MGVIKCDINSSSAIWISSGEWMEPGGRLGGPAGWWPRFRLTGHWKYSDSSLFLFFSMTVYVCVCVCLSVCLCVLMNNFWFGDCGLSSNVTYSNFRIAVSSIAHILIWISIQIYRMSVVVVAVDVDAHPCGLYIYKYIFFLSSLFLNAFNIAMGLIGWLKIMMCKPAPIITR